MSDTACSCDTNAASGNQRPCFVRSAECITAFGDSSATLGKLLEGRVALAATPALMADGGELVPMALRGTFREGSPPRWWEDLLEFLSPVASGGWGSARSPVFFASSNFGIDGLYLTGKRRSSADVPFSTPHGCVQRLRESMGWGPVCWILSHACVSAQLAMDRAADAVSSRRADRALVVSFDYVGPFVSGGFHALKILNTDMPAPFGDVGIGSIGLGDGAGFVEISAEPSKFEIAALGTYNEMYHFTSTEPTGSGFRKLLEPMADRLRNCHPWIKGHGTGTLEPGRIEARTLEEMLPSSPLVSWKGSIGHTLGSCAAVELAIAMCAVDFGSIPGTVGARPPYFATNVMSAPFSPADHDSVLLLCNAFGGAHGSMLLRYD